MREEEARLLWEPARAQIADALAEDGRRLQNDIYRWKLANREQVDALKREVERFTSHIKELPRDQSQLF
jgi:NAD-specific glutamate dehydrogenase